MTSRRTVRCAAATAALLVAATAVPAAAHPDRALDPTLPVDATYAATDNIDYLGRFPEHAGTAGGRLSDDGKLFYVTDPRGVFIYDVRKPAVPELLGSVAVYQQTTGVALAQEDPDTNGRILLVDGATTPVGAARLQVVDVSNPRAPKILSTVDASDHTWTCVSGVVARRTNSCAFAYGREGYVVDLTDPAEPVLLDETWREAVGYGGLGNSPYTHDLTELRPGLVMSAGSTAILMDTTNPRRPVRLAAIEQEGRFSSLGYHSVEWGRGGRAPYVVLGTEISSGSDCDGDNSVVETWDARAVVKAVDAYAAGRGMAALRSARFTRVDAFDAGRRGIFLQGAAPANALYCAHWMDLHPRFNRGGRMAVSYYERGTRFVDVAANGAMEEIGWFVPAEGFSGSPRWISDDVVYVMDYRRGMEVLRLSNRKPTGVRHVTPAGPVDDSGFRSTGLVTFGGPAVLLLVLIGATRRQHRAAADRAAARTA